MAEMCANCGAAFGSPEALLHHMGEVHGGGNPTESFFLNPEAARPGLVCALCGRQFADRQSLVRHNLSPHYRSNRPRPEGPGYQAAL